MENIFKLTSKYLTALDGVRLHYLQTPRGKKPEWLLLLHGAGGDATAWRDVQRLCYEEGYGSLALDLRGHGLSDDPIDSGAYAFERMAQDVSQLNDVERLENVVVVGHCFGGMTAIVFAASTHQAIKKLVLVDTSYEFGFFGYTSRIFVRLAKITRALAYLFPPGSRQVRSSYATFVGTGDINLKRFISDVRATSLRSYLFCYGDLFEFNATQLLEKISVPTLVICGARDTIFPPSISEKLSRMIKGSQLTIVPGENHIIVLNNPRKLSEIIVRFVGHIHSRS